MNFLDVKKFQEVSADNTPFDLRIGNWESPIWGGGGVNVLKSPRVYTTEQAAECALSLKINVALLANNHAYDCLEDGFEKDNQFF